MNNRYSLPRILQKLIVASATVFLLFSAPAMSASSVETRTAADWIKLFQIPAASDSWELNGHINGQDIHLRLPDDTAKLDTFPADVKALISKRVTLRQENLKILRNSFSNLVAVLDRTSLHMAPEYEQPLSEVLLSIYSEQGEPAIRRHLPLLRALPDYTEFNFFVPDHMSEQVELELASNNISNKFQIHVVEKPSVIEENSGFRFPLTVWTRDVLEITVDTKTRIPYGLVPLAYYDDLNLAQPDNDYLQELANPAFKTLSIPLFFKSGNLSVGEAGGMRTLFIGDRELKNLKKHYFNAFFFSPPESAVMELLKVLSGVENVVVLQNSEHLFHLDMMLVFLAPDVVGILDPLDPENMITENTDALAMARRNLLHLGYTIVDIPSTAEQINSYQSSTNAVPFRHAMTGKPTILVPQFDKAAQDDMHALVERSYRSAGYDVIFVQDLFSDMHGNIHCTIANLD